jgi:putative ABC transport system permease protein
LGIQQGDKILLVTRTSEGGLNGIKLPVAGFFRLGMPAYDKGFFFLSLDNAKQLLKLEGMSTEILVFKDRRTKDETVISSIRKILAPGLIVQSPEDQLGSYFGLLKASKVMYNLFMLFILFLASFVVVNTMMMSVLERVKEIGMLKALGMTDRELAINFTLEGGIIGGIGGVLGTVLGAVFVGVLSQTGVDMTDAVHGLDIPLESVIRPQISLGEILYCLISSIIVPAFASMIPAQYVKKFTPAEALRKI